jgi:hypothetical protein
MGTVVMGTVGMGIGTVAMGIGMVVMGIGMVAMVIGMVATGAVMDGAVGGVQASASMSAATDAAAGTRTMAIIPAAIAGATNLHKYTVGTVRVRYRYGCSLSPMSTATPISVTHKSLMG